jgi:hypothetical protein
MTVFESYKIRINQQRALREAVDALYRLGNVLDAPEVNIAAAQVVGLKTRMFHEWRKEQMLEDHGI